MTFFWDTVYYLSFCSVSYCAVKLLETLIHMVIRDDTIHTLGARYIKLVYVYVYDQFTLGDQGEKTHMDMESHMPMVC